jgi:hypothetical protein
LGNILHMSTDDVRSVVQQLNKTFDEMRAWVDNLSNRVENLPWEGLGKEQFVEEFHQFTRSFNSRVEEGVDQTRRVSNEVIQWEDMSIGVEGNSISTGLDFQNIFPVSPSIMQVGGSSVNRPVIPKSFYDFLSTTETGLKAFDVLQAIAIVGAITPGMKYLGEIKFSGSEWYKQLILGLDSGKLTHIKDTNFIADKFDGELFGEGIGGSLAALSLGISWGKDIYTHQNEKDHILPAMAVDVGIVAAETYAASAGAAIGAPVGGAIGGVIGGIIGSVVPVAGTAAGIVAGEAIGTVVGGLVGGIAASWATDYILTQPVQTVLPQSGSFIGGVVGSSLGPLGPVLAPISSALGGQAGSSVAQWITGPKCSTVSFKDIAVDGVVEAQNWVSNSVKNILWSSPYRVDQVFIT